jgi:hypothetical protein
MAQYILTLSDDSSRYTWVYFLMNLDVYLIEFILGNLKAPYDLLCSTFYASWESKKEDGKVYSFDSFCGLLIRAHEKFLDEGKLKIKQQAHLLKPKV